MFDFPAITKTVKYFLWKAIEFPFKIWNMFPNWIHWLALLSIGAVGAYLCVIAYRDREKWRHRYFD